MKMIKIAFWVIVIGFFGLMIFQNQDFFLSRHSLGIDLQVVAYRTTEMPNAVLFAAFFLLGWLFAYAFGLVERYKAGRSNKMMRQTIASQDDAISSLKKDVELLKTGVHSSNARVESTAKNLPESAASVLTDPK